MNIQQLIAQIILELMPHLILLSLVSGAVGAMLSNILFGWLEGLAEKANAKRRAANWKKSQDMAKAEKGAQLRGDGVGGRACETPSDSAA